MKDRRQRWREKHPYPFAYQSLKARAKYRGKPFTLTFVQFLLIPDIDLYVWLRGRGKLDYVMDRKHNALGYVEGNCQVITNQENSRKRWRDYDPEPIDPRLVSDIVCPF